MSPAYPTRVHPELGFRQLDPLPEADDHLSFYRNSRYFDLVRQGGRANELGRLLAGGETAAREREWLAATLYVDIADGLAALIPPGSPVLEIGAGTGDCVAYLSGYGYVASGIDSSQEASRIAREQGRTVCAATAEEWAANPENRGAYAGVTLLNVLEHVADPLGLLRDAHALLTPGGAVCVRVPNDFTEWQAAVQRARAPWWVTAPDHINYFSHSSLAATLEACGFAMARMTTDFPMELFLLMGDDYVDEPALGAQLHEKRRRFDLALPKPLRQRLYAAFAAAGAGRNSLAFAVKPA